MELQISFNFKIVKNKQEEIINNDHHHPSKKTKATNSNQTNSMQIMQLPWTEPTQINLGLCIKHQHKEKGEKKKTIT